MDRLSSTENTLLYQAKEFHRHGKNDKACSIYSQILKKHPKHIEAIRLRAVIYLDNGDTYNCSRLLKQAIHLSPNNPSIHNNMGSLLQKQKRYQEAIEQFELALKLSPNFTHATNNLGICLRLINQPELALAAYNKALAIDPEFAEAWNNLGNLLHSQSHFKHAVTCFKEAIRINNNYSDAWNNLAYSYSLENKTELAIDAYSHAIRINPDDSKALNNLSHLHLGNNNYESASKYFKKALKFHANIAEFWIGYGFTQHKLGLLSKALESFKKAIELNKLDPIAWNNLGVVHADIGSIDPALTSLQKALDLSPNFVSCHSNKLLYLNYLDDIHDHTLLDAHKHWAVAHQNYPNSIKYHTRNSSNKIRIGFVSGDFRRHPTSYFLLPVLHHLSRDQFEIYCYSNSKIRDDQTTKILLLSNKWRDIYNDNDDTLTKRITKDKIDILFDLSGHTSGNRLTAFSLKPAPVQISWLGYPHTTALDAIDAYLTDNIYTPNYCQWMYTEKLLPLNHSKFCYEAPDYTPNVQCCPPALKNKQITFGCFNSPSKVNDRTIAIWSQVLKQLPCSIIIFCWSTTHDYAVKHRIIKDFASHGISEKQVQFSEEKLAHKQIFEEYNKVDIALDTFPFSGGLTTCEALWMGVPVSTLASNRPSSRQSASILTEIELDDLVSFSETEYIKTTVSLANDIPKLQILRKSLRKKIKSSTLSDGKKFTAEFEKAIITLMNKKLQQNTVDA